MACSSVSPPGQRPALCLKLLAMSAFADEPNDAAKRLLRLGERLGYLTYEMIADELPEERFTDDKLDALLLEIDRRGIRLIDEADLRGV